MSQTNRAASDPLTTGLSARAIGFVLAAGLGLVAIAWLTIGPGFEGRGELGALIGVFRVTATSVALVAPFWLTAAGLGFGLRRRLAPSLTGFAAGVTQLALGAAGAMVIIFLLAWADLLNGWAVVLLGLIGALMLISQVRQSLLKPTVVEAGVATEAAPAPPAADPQDSPDTPRDADWWAPLLFALPLAMLLVAAACAPGGIWAVEAYGYDVLSYHLQLPREWFDAGGWRGLEHHVYSFFPSLMELAFLHVITTAGGLTPASIYACQFLHLSFALLAAAGVGSLGALLAGRRVGVLIAAVFLATPWTLILGSMAYNEMTYLAFGAAALRLMFDPQAGRSVRAAASVGLLVGAATLSKLVAGPQIALPAGLILLLGLNRAPADAQPAPSRRSALARAVTAGAVGSLLLLPYFARNAWVTGNPVFPFATAALGTGHWTPEEARRWDEGHASDKPWTERLEAWVIHFWGNQGYGAFGGTERETAGRAFAQYNVAHFRVERGWPTIWILAALGGALLLRRSADRRLLIAMTLMAGVGTAFWFTSSHLQSRFLVAMLLPALAVIAAATHRLAGLLPPNARWAGPAVLVALVLALTAASMGVLQRQTLGFIDAQGRRQVVPLSFLVDAIPRDMADNQPDEGALPLGDHLVNRLPPGSVVYSVADNSRLLYMRTPVIYESAFDASRLGRIVREQAHEPERINQALRNLGVSHVWIHWSELRRLHATYGHDADVTEALLRRLIDTGWALVARVGHAAELYRLPPAPPGP